MMFESLLFSMCRRCSNANQYHYNMKCGGLSRENKVFAEQKRKSRFLRNIQFLRLKVLRGDTKIAVKCDEKRGKTQKMHIEIRGGKL